jgi:hypothetical protein
MLLELTGHNGKDIILNTDHIVFHIVLIYAGDNSLSVVELTTADKYGNRRQIYVRENLNELLEKYEAKKNSRFIST